jgi:hypothetical protein
MVLFERKVPNSMKPDYLEESRNVKITLRA